MSMFRKFRHYSTKKVVEAMVQPEEEGVRIILRGAVSAATLFPKDGREAALLALVNELDSIGYEPETRWVGAKDRQLWWEER